MASITLRRSRLLYSLLSSCRGKNQYCSLAVKNPATSVEGTKSEDAKVETSQISGKESVQNDAIEETDFFGINSDIEGWIPGKDKMLTQEELAEKYEETLRRPQRDKIYVTNFGTIRLDIDNAATPRTNEGKSVDRPNAKLDSHSVTEDAQVQLSQRNMRYTRNMRITESAMSDAIGDNATDMLSRSLLQEKQSLDSYTPLSKEVIEAGRANIREIDPSSDFRQDAEEDKASKTEDVSYFDREYFHDLSKTAAKKDRSEERGKLSKSTDERVEETLKSAVQELDEVSNFDREHFPNISKTTAIEDRAKGRGKSSKFAKFVSTEVDVDERMENTLKTAIRENDDISNFDQEHFRNISKKSTMEESSKRGTSNSTTDKTVDASYFDEHYFQNGATSTGVSTEDNVDKRTKAAPKSAVADDIEDVSLFDREYFPTEVESKPTSKDARKLEMCPSSDESSFIDNKYFGRLTDKEILDASTPLKDFRKSVINEELKTKEVKTIKKETKRGKVSSPIEDVVASPELNMDENFSSNHKKHADKNIESVSTEEAEELEEEEELEYSQPMSNKKTSAKPALDMKNEFLHSESALDYVIKRRKETAAAAAAAGAATARNANNQAMEDLKNPLSRTAKAKTTPEWMKECFVDLNKQDEYTVLHTLKNNILYNDHGIVALDKPYGLACQMGKKQHHYLQKYLPELAKLIDRSNPNPKLIPVHRLDVGTTGILLLAKNEKIADTLRMLFREHKIRKMYWAITRGIPNPTEGIINIPIGEGLIEGRVRMALRPEFDVDYKKRTRKELSSVPAVTHYRVIGEHKKAALIELHPKTGVKHQLRVHLAFAMNCPILGDHKYSHVDRLAPQKLPDILLERLQVRQTKVRDLPVFLHSRTVVIPEVIEGRNIFVRANLPKHFKWVFRKLKFSVEDDLHQNNK